MGICNILLLSISSLYLFTLGHCNFKSWYPGETTDDQLSTSLIEEVSIPLNNDVVCAIRASLNNDSHSFQFDSSAANCRIYSFKLEVNQWSIGTVVQIKADTPLLKGCSMTNGSYVTDESSWINSCTIHRCNNGVHSSILVTADDCSELSNGIFYICPVANPVETVCQNESNSDGGQPWTVFQMRKPQTNRDYYSFFRTFAEYEKGFGDLNGEFWLGLKALHELTHSTAMEMKVELEDWDGIKKWAKYSHFSIGDSSSKYTLSISGYTGDAGDGLTVHHGLAFAAKDNDNVYGAANTWQGAWWYSSGHSSNLNGLPIEIQPATHGIGITWHGFHQTHEYSLKKSVMMVRPYNP